MLDGVRAIHCVGVGGSGMSAIAEVLLRLGFRVSGSDEVRSGAIDRLAALGLRFAEGHRPDHVGDADVVVVSSAVAAGNPEVREAGRRGLPVWRRGEMLAALMAPRFGIAIAGAHGKTTTTAMVALMLERAGLDPTAVIGGRLRAFGSNARVGAGDLFVAEADESDRSFLLLDPKMAVITNVDYEHLDSYQGFPDLLDAFVAFAERVPETGRVVLCLDDEHVRALQPRITRRVITYGVDADGADVTVRDLKLHAAGSRGTVLDRRGGPMGAAEDREGIAAGGREPADAPPQEAAAAVLGTLTLQVPGRHNVQNALAAVAVGLELGLRFDQVAPGLEAFTGADRRFEFKGEVSGIRVVDDYGHHPTEVAAVLAAAQVERRGGRVLVVFQPHRYSRTRHLRDAFGPALAGADLILLTDIYGAGEASIPGVTIEWLAEAVEASAPGRVQIVRSLADVPAAVVQAARPGDLVITLGAGSIGRVAPRILEELSRCR